MRRLVFWNDTQKVAVINGSDLQTPMDMRSLLKTNVTQETDNKKSRATFFFADEQSNLTVTLTVSAGVVKSRFEQLPHLLLSPTSFHLQINVAGASPVKYVNCRLLLELELYHRNGSVTTVTDTTIDDEYSPGVFSVSTTRVEAEASSFLQCKSVGYSKDDRIIAHTLDANVTLAESEEESVGKTVSGFYSQSRTDFNRTHITVAFGGPKDSFYSDFSSFSLVIGLGNPEKESLSFTVQLVIGIGFGVPVLALFVAAAFMLFRRIKSRVASRQHLLED